MIDKYAKYNKIYTDGSICNNIRGCALIVGEEIFRFKLPQYFSIFSCELFAIEKGLDLIEEQKIKKAIICTDSKSAIDALKNPANHDEDVQRCQSKLSKISLSMEIIIAWIPAHQEIHGNETADLNAKQATTDGIDLSTSLPTSVNDLKKYIKKHIQDEWNKR
ncbi:Protein of unknown function [Cotesia congregata]|uniref:RNase H type-1 domain-containing protein n=1 Tax=Cotesia congregata TaxID=51543 RepID=A0A8J2HNA9_COTCN|nr:Protein of unknown function [Cotesia congregata]